MTVFVLYGATGDLAKRMVLPAFFDLYARGLLPRRWKLVGNGRGDVAHEDFRGHVHDVLITVGPLAAAMTDRFDGEVYPVADAEEAASLLPELLAPGDAVLVKASRGVGLEVVCRALEAGVA